MYKLSDYQKTADFIKKELPDNTKTAIILGSGLGCLTNELVKAKYFTYNEIPNFLQTTAHSHAGRLYVGELSEKPVLIMSGRFHYYEGYEWEQTAFPVRVMKLLGIENIIITNAAGGINESFAAGDFMLIEDHVKLTALSPVRGENDNTFGSRFFDMTSAYDKKLISLAKKAANDIRLDIKTGVYAYMAGPQFETPAEIKMLRILGADAVGMSTVAEVIAANQCGMKILGISCISNMAAGITKNKVTAEEVSTVTASSSGEFSLLVKNILARM